MIDRSREVAQVVEQHKNLFGTDDSRRPILYYICYELNKLDGPVWGLLIKHDHNDFIPSDVIVYKPELRTVDVLAGGDKALWDVQGTVDGVTWAWLAAPIPADVEPPSAPPDPSLPPSLPAESELEPIILKFVEEIRADFKRLEVELELLRLAVNADKPAPAVKFPTYSGHVQIPFVGSRTITLEPQK